MGRSHIGFTIRSNIPVDAFTGKIINILHTFGIGMTRDTFTFVFIYVTVAACVPPWADAGIIVDSVNTGGAIEAGIACGCTVVHVVLTMISTPPRHALTDPTRRTPTLSHHTVLMITTLEIIAGI